MRHGLPGAVASDLFLPICALKPHKYLLEVLVFEASAGRAGGRRSRWGNFQREHLPPPNAHLGQER